MFNYIKRFLGYLPIIFLLIYIVLVFFPLILGRLPIPADTIVGLYHPWRDQLVNQYPSGVPFKNFLITDPVRQQYPWRELAINELKKGHWPVWNPYSGLGKPLLANLQTAALYPLNFLYWLLPFSWGWSLQVVLQSVFGGLFMWLYLKNLKLRPEACALGLLAWAGSGFFVAWLEWNTLVQVAIWLPLLLLAIDKIFAAETKLWWGSVFALSLTSSFLAGHPQIFFYVTTFIWIYLLKNLIQTKQWRLLFPFIIYHLSFIMIALPQLLPTLNLFASGIRSIGHTDWLNPGWFLPWQHLAQFLAPDFFGNPATGNYFGIWNYGEMVGFIGLVPLIFALLALSRKNLFWIASLAICLALVLPSFISEIPYRLAIPFLATLQPTRLLVLIDFSLAVLAAYGFDSYLKKDHRASWVIILLAIILAILWFIAIRFGLTISEKNLVWPSIVFIVTIGILVFQTKFSDRWKVSGFIAGFVLLILTTLDLGRFATKFESFSPDQWLYPETKITKYLEDQSQKSDFRVVALDDRIFPPNFSTHYKIKMVSDYDSVYLPGEIKLLGGPSRILTPKDISAKSLKLFNIRYLLTFGNLDESRFALIMNEGTTKLYEVK